MLDSKDTIHFDNINQILQNEILKKNKNYHLDHWEVNYDTTQDKTKFYFNLFASYRPEKLTAFKKIFDYCYSNKIDFFQIFHETCVVNKKYRLNLYPEYLDFIYYSIKKNYCPRNYDFSVFFNIYPKTTKTNYLAQYKLLPFLDRSEKSLMIHIRLFENYLKNFPMFSLEEQKEIQSIFQSFEHQNFYPKYISQIQNLYPLLIKTEELSQFQEKSFFSKKIQLSYYHEIPRLEDMIKNNLINIYETILTTHKEKKLIDDFICQYDEKNFYVYLFDSDPQRLEKNLKTLQSFHQKIQLSLKESHSNDYYQKLYDYLYLSELLENKNTIKNTTKI